MLPREEFALFDALFGFELTPTLPRREMPKWLVQVNALCSFTAGC